MVVIEEFKSVQKNTLRGFARVRFPSGIIISEISLHVSDGRCWASPPSRPMTDRDGQVMRDSEGKTRWQPLISFSNKSVRDNWSAQIVQAVHDAYPTAVRDAVPERAA